MEVWLVEVWLVLVGVVSAPEKKKINGERALNYTIVK